MSANPSRSHGPAGQLKLLCVRACVRLFAACTLQPGACVCRSVEATLWSGPTLILAGHCERGCCVAASACPRMTTTTTTEITIEIAFGELLDNSACVWLLHGSQQQQQHRRPSTNLGRHVRAVPFGCPCVCVCVWTCLLEQASVRLHVRLPVCLARHRARTKIPFQAWRICCCHDVPPRENENPTVRQQLIGFVQPTNIQFMIYS